jgi:hypothetical protein
VLGFVDYPLNNRWWWEDEFRKIRALPSAGEKRARLHELAVWENPGPGSFYDDIGNIAKSPRVLRTAFNPDRGSVQEMDLTFWWWDQGKSRARLSWQVTAWPVAIIYEDLDEHGKYIVRSSGYGQAIVRINGELVNADRDAREMGQVREFPVDPKFLKDGRIVLTWDPPRDEGHLNWRQKSRLAEVWLINRR